MLRKFDYYKSLANAVARLDRDSYELRGAIYDRALTNLANSLYSAVPPLSQFDVDAEFRAFREAVRRVEFGDLDDLDWLERRSEPIPPPAPIPPISRDLQQVAPVRSPALADRNRIRRALAVAPRRRSVAGRVARRMVYAAVLIGLGIAGYAYATGQFELPPLARLLDRIAGSDIVGGPGGSAIAPERATYFEPGGSAGTQEFSGQALWRVRSEAAGRGQAPEAVMVLEVECLERGFALTMSMRRDASQGAVMSHLIEFKFAGSNEFSIDRIAGVTGLSLRSIEDKSGTALSGMSIKVAPGLFLFGLSAEQADIRRNVELMRAKSVLEIPIAFADGRSGVLAVEKGASGAQALDDAFKLWAR